MVGMGVECMVVAASDSGASITLPWFAWTALAAGMTGAIAWLARTWKSHVEASHNDVMTLAREVTQALVETTRSNQELRAAVRELERTVGAWSAQE